MAQGVENLVEAVATHKFLGLKWKIILRQTFERGNKLEA